MQPLSAWRERRAHGALLLPRALPLLLLALAALAPAPAAAAKRHRHRWSPYVSDGKLLIPFGKDSRGSAAAGLRHSSGGAGAGGGDHGDSLPPGVAYKQIIARSEGGETKFNADLNMTLPAPWDIVNLTQVLEDNLAPTARFWRQVRRKPRVRDLFDAAVHSELYAQTDTKRLVVIHNNMITFPLMPPGIQQFQCDERCNPELTAFLDAMHAAVRVYKLQLPNVVFNLNVIDSGAFCMRSGDESRADTPDPERACAAPAVSISGLDAATNLLAPMMLLPDANVTWRHAPWAAKAGKAFFRGVPSCGEMAFEVACSRIWVARLAQLRPELFDAGLVEEISREDAANDPTMKDGRGPLPLLGRVPRENLTHFKYLLNLDGHSAAYRFASLLGANSLVLKQRSRHLEWFYRSVQPWRHYVPILETNRTDVLDRLAWAEAHEAEVRAIVDAANRFALTYTTYYSRILYWIYTLEVYRGLFDDMDYYFESRGADVRDLVQAHHRERLRQSGGGIEGVLRAALQEAGGGGEGGEGGGGGKGSGGSGGGKGSGGGRKGGKGHGGAPGARRPRAGAGAGAHGGRGDERR
ncbi:MAG: glycosyl transferase family 90-domain-containing protein [Monoraphidium minutum]|nr:MAG: glycosyl transferase family 90-domain-containing protein [Monoraphidium minutum]